MSRVSFRDVYRRFASIWADGDPIVNETALRAAIDATGFKLEDISEAWLRALDPEWVYGRQNRPFRDEDLNRRYWLLISSGA
jgi:hypothetical protein